MAALAGRKLHLAPEAVLVASTGKIGMPMPMDKVRGGPASELVVTPEGGHDFAQAIMTTDTRRKESGRAWCRTRPGGRRGTPSPAAPRARA